MNDSIWNQFEDVTNSKGFNMMCESIGRSFKDDKDFTYWAFAGGVNLFSYIKALEDKKAVEELTNMISDVIRPNLSKKELDMIRKDKAAFNFIVKWFRYLGQKYEVLSKIKHMPAAKRNLYSNFVCMLLRFTKPNTEEVNSATEEVAN